MKVTTITINWNTPASLQGQLESLCSGNSGNLQTIVVDNATLSEAQKQELLSKFSGVKFIFNQQNLGFGRAANLGTKSAQGEWFLFLNPDVQIDVAQIEELVAYANANNLVATCPSPTSANYAKPVPTALTLLLEFSPLGRVGVLSSLVRNYPKTLWGGALLIKKEVFEVLGGFDEQFFLWFEDSDLCARLQKCGYKFAQSDVHVAHIGGESFETLPTAQKKKMFFESMQIYARKHFGVIGKLAVLIIKILNS